MTIGGKETGMCCIREMNHRVWERWAFLIRRFVVATFAIPCGVANWFAFAASTFFIESNSSWPFLDLDWCGLCSMVLRMLLSKREDWWIISHFRTYLHEFDDLVRESTGNETKNDVWRFFEIEDQQSTKQSYHCFFCEWSYISTNLLDLSWPTSRAATQCLLPPGCASASFRFLV